MPFRLRPGDDASCLNLVSAAQSAHPGASRRPFHSRRVAGESWLTAKPAAMALIPAIADANSMTYVLH